MKKPKRKPARSLIGSVIFNGNIGIKVLVCSDDKCMSEDDMKEYAIDRVVEDCRVQHSVDILIDDNEAVVFVDQNPTVNP